MIDYTPQLKAADRLANLVEELLKEKCTLAVLSTALLEYRAAQALSDLELSQLFIELQKQIKPELDFEEKNVYRYIQSKNKDD